MVGAAGIFNGNRACPQVNPRRQPLGEGGSHGLIALKVDAADLAAAVVEVALRVTVKAKKHDYREWLAYEFTTRKPNEATAEMHWEELAVAWNARIREVPNIYSHCTLKVFLSAADCSLVRRVWTG